MAVKIIKKSVFALKEIAPVVFLALFTLPGVSVANGGILSFYGKLVEASCETSGPASRPVVSCYRKGKWVTKPILLKADTQGYLPYGMGTTRLRWIDKDKRLAIMTISYH